MEIRALNKQLFEKTLVENNINDDNVEKLSTIFFISINNSHGDDFFSNSYFLSEHENVAIFHFDDVENENELDPFGVPGKPFTDEMAEKMFSFIDKHHEKDMCLIHCAAGISRSSGVALFINDLYGTSYKQFKKNNPGILPNQHVLRMLYKIYHETHNLNEE